MSKKEKPLTLSQLRKQSEEVGKEWFIAFLKNHVVHYLQLLAKCSHMSEFSDENNETIARHLTKIAQKNWAPELPVLTTNHYDEIRVKYGYSKAKKGIDNYWANCNEGHLVRFMREHAATLVHVEKLEEKVKEHESCSQEVNKPLKLVPQAGDTNKIKKLERMLVEVTAEVDCLLPLANIDREGVAAMLLDARRDEAERITSSSHQAV